MYIGMQLDISAEFETELLGSGAMEEGYGCSGGAVDRSAMGPFGLLVNAHDSLSELTPIFFRSSNTTNGTNTYFCTDETRFVCFESELIPFDCPFEVSNRICKCLI